jgi:hypothetical protein
MSPSHDLTYRSIEDSNYLPGTSFGIPKFDAMLDNM